MRRADQKIETFPDGVVLVYPALNGRKVGSLKGRFHFELQSVGVNRYYQAQSSTLGNQVDKMIKVPHTNIVNTQDIAVILADGSQYRITRIQEKPERRVDLWELESVQVSIPKG